MPDQNIKETSQISEAVLQQHINNLSADITPSRDLWQGIERAIHVKPKTSGSFIYLKAPMAWAASILVAVLLSWYSFTPTARINTNEAEGLLVQIQQQFNQQKQMLLVSYGDVTGQNFSPAMQVQLAQLVSARESIVKALMKDNSNSDLLNLLQFTQQQELNLMQRLYRGNSVKANQLQTI